MASVPGSTTGSNDVSPASDAGGTGTAAQSVATQGGAELAALEAGRTFDSLEEAEAAAAEAQAALEAEYRAKDRDTHSLQNASGAASVSGAGLLTGEGFKFGSMRALLEEVYAEHAPERSEQVDEVLEVSPGVRGGVYCGSIHECSHDVVPCDAANLNGSLVSPLGLGGRRGYAGGDASQQVSASPGAHTGAR
jgi:hypothetical protein